MKAIVDPLHVLARGLGAIRQQFQVPEGFPPELIAEAEQLARRPVDGHADRTDMPFVTLDPATSTDLDQAFCFTRDGAAIVLHYAIADVGWFVPDGSLVDAEAWRRGASIYLPDGKEALYPTVLSEAAASLLPDGPRPAVVFRVSVDEAGDATLTGVERSLIQSRAKLAYDQVIPEQFPPEFHELAQRIHAAEARRGASRVDPPEQEVNAVEGDGYELRFRPRLESEAQNSALSLACNLAVARMLFDHRTGLFRVMANPTKRAVRRLRHTARAFEIDWPKEDSLETFQDGLDSSKPRDAAMMMAIRRAGEGASYVPYREGAVPFHSAMAATYAHATAPLRRLADRYVVEAALAVANGNPVPANVAAAFERLPGVMAKSDSLDSNLRRAVVDLAEAVMLMSSVGTTHSAVITDVDERGARIQLCDLPIVSRVVADGAEPGNVLEVVLTEADPDRRLIRFERAT